MKKHHGDEQWLAALNGNACRGKHRSPSKQHALAVARRIQQRGDDTVRSPQHTLNAYKCRACGSWHIGHFRRVHVRDASAIASEATWLELALADALRPYLASAATAC